MKDEPNDKRLIVIAGEKLYVSPEAAEEYNKLLKAASEPTTSDKVATVIAGVIVACIPILIILAIAYTVFRLISRI